MARYSRYFNAFSYFSTWHLYDLMFPGYSRYKNGFYCILCLWLFAWASSCSGPDKPQPPRTELIFTESDGQAQADVLLEKGKEIEDKYPDSALILMKEALTVSGYNHYEKGILKALKAISDHYTRSDIEPDSCISFFVAVKYPSLQAKAITCLALAKAYADKDEIEKALEYGTKTLGLINSMPRPDSACLLEASINIGVFYLRLGNYTASLEHFEKAGTIALSRKDTATMLDVDLYKGGAFASNGVFPQAEMYFKKVLEAGIVRKDSPRVKNALISLGNCYARGGKAEEAIKYLTQAAALRINRQKETADEVTIYWTMADLFKKEGDFKRAEDNYQKAIDLSYSNTKTDYRLANLLQDMADLYYSEGIYQKAYDLHKGGIARFLERINDEAAVSYTALATKYKLSEKNRIIADNKTEIARQRERIQRQYFLLVIFALSVVIITLLALALIIHRRNKTKISLIKGKMEGVEQERARLSRELHDGIVSELSGISYKLKAIPWGGSVRESSLKDEVTAALELLQNSISELRNAAHNLLPDIIAKVGLVEAVRIFCKKLDHPGFRITVLSYGELPGTAYEFQLAVYRIIQEAVTNISKHTNAGNVVVQFNVIRQQLDISVEDDSTNGAPLGRTGYGTGILNMETRLRAVEGHMDTRYTDKGVCLYFDVDFGKFIMGAHEED